LAEKKIEIFPGEICFIRRRGKQLSAAKRLSSFENRPEVKQFIKGSESNQRPTLLSESQQIEKPLSKTVSAACETGISIDSTTPKPERMGLESLLPFLEERVALTMPSDIKYLDCVLDYLNERMLKLGISGQDDSQILIALDEAIVNAIKHGNKYDPNKAVRITAEFNPDCVCFTVADEGAGFKRDSVPDPTDPSRLLEPNGRGLLLMNHIMDEVCYNQTGNQLEMRKKVDRSLQAESSVETTLRPPKD
jgi:serine/threonine-protein kinase RsbW